jgi:hypothetical protein
MLRGPASITGTLAPDAADPGWLASHRVRFRWERLALAQRRGEAIPPIQVYRVCDRHFVIDGHHRVSIAAATGERQIEAYVTQVLAAVPCGRLVTVALPVTCSRRARKSRGDPRCGVGSGRGCSQQG